MSDEDDYEVGYKKPPKHTRFKKGQSGNPKGRPKGSRNFSTDLKATLEQAVRVNAGGRPRTVSTQLAVLLRLREKALRGDGRALDRLLGLASAYNDENTAEEALSSSDAEILTGFLARQQRTETAMASDTEAPPDSGADEDASEDTAGEIPDEDDLYDILR